MCIKLFQRSMVLINLNKLLGFISLISNTPKEVSRRKRRLIDAYNMLKADTEDVVSIKLYSSLERWKKENHRKEIFSWLPIS